MKIIRNRLSVLVLSAFILGIASVAYAEDENTYMYISNSGEEVFEVADNWQEAIIEAENIASNSGVLLVDTTPSVLATVVDDEDETYVYVDVNGNLRTEVAETPSEAISEAEAIHPNSGVALYTEMILE